MPDNANRRPWWSHARLSVRGLMVIVLCVGAWLGSIVRAARTQRDAVAAIIRAGGGVWYSWNRMNVNGQPIWVRRDPEWPKCLVDRLGVDYFGHVAIVNLTGDGNRWNPKNLEPWSFRRDRRRHAKTLGEEEMKQLSELTHIEELYLDYAKVGDAELANLKGLTNLRWLGLAGTQTSDAGLAHLGQFPLIQHLGLRGTCVTDNGLAHLNRMPRLKYLDLDYTRVSDAGLAHLKRLTNLQELHLQGTMVTHTGLQELQGTLPSLRITWGTWLAPIVITETGTRNLSGDAAK
jgi:hypothetical protein